MSKNLKLLASFILPEICDDLCEALQNAEIDFYIEDESSSTDPIGMEVFPATNLFVSEENYDAALAIKVKLEEETE